ncbi:hypothetical protein SAMN04515695_2083 [Pseudovibrio sp. Tun.PSC04-5.I4]|nr:hypothetical protein SAMN04515695_2083 [Pseudovibrio sp. Tun.PSC04-5.I4]
MKVGFYIELGLFHLVRILIRKPGPLFRTTLYCTKTTYFPVSWLIVTFLLVFGLISALCFRRC